MPTENLHIEPSGAALGASVHGVDFSKPVDNSTKNALRSAWLEHLVLVIPQQSLTAQAYFEAARIFGIPQVGAARKYYEQTGKKSLANSLPVAEISVLSNLDENGQPTERNDGLGSEEVVWHSDNSYIERPPAGSTLYALEIPEDGSGKTSFSNQYLALEELPTHLRAVIEGKCSKQDATRNSAGVLRPGVSLPKSPEDVPGPMHPLIRVHPETGRQALYLGRRRAWPSQFIEGLSNDDSEALLDELWTHASSARYAWTHQWAPGDMLVWDNRCTMHYREPVNSAHRRVMWRSQFQGEPVLSTLN